MEPEQWISNFASRTGIDPPDAEEVVSLLELAAEAAHSWARTAAPIACSIAGRSGLPAADLIEAARQAGAE